MKTPALPYPLSLTVDVYRDDGNWGAVTRWFMRSMHVLQELFVVRITLAHYEGEDEPCYTHDEWCRKADQLLETYPNCVFIYAER